ncbi:GNAT family N-acetyltransferase [Pseudoxanthomonas spadix]|uniref:GNAT family N-acetyltransferase n=1 Tax=Pseudoxanthomonas spadix TaxID=415229 RepID=UPI000EFDD357|nr:GNAT family N-acetyltransferase [Pseudoxanthomonas spadix]MBP3973270.1 N-acetyltransferase [Pseudoxanthomonas spadix]RMW96521.1 N-acetyltransferase [Pseudoxanthomonas spadix]
MTQPVHHQPQANRFVIDADGQQAVLDYQLQGHRMVITHTGVPTALRGRGLAEALTRAALAHAQDQGLKVTPACSYAASFLERHPEYAALSK